MFNDSYKISFTLTFDSWFTYRKPVETGLEFQLHKGSAQNINLGNFVIVAHKKLVE